MTTATALRAETDIFVGDVLVVTGAVETAQDYGERAGLALNTPVTIANRLVGIADPLKLPDVVITPLSLIPYGIGIAVKKFDQVTGATTDEMLLQADRLYDLDLKLKPATNKVEAFNKYVTVPDKLAKGYAEIVEQQQREAVRIEAHIGAETLNGTALGLKIDDRLAALSIWNDTRRDVVQAIDGAADAMAAAIDGFARAVPNLAVLDDAAAVIEGAFGPLRGALDTIDDILNTTYTVVPAVTVTPAIKVPPLIVFGKVVIPGYTIPAVVTPAVTVNPGAIITTIGNAIQIVQDFVENLLLSALDALGFDFFGAIDALKDTLLAPLEPVFDAIASIADAARALIDDVVGLFDGLTAAIDGAIDAVAEAIGAQSLFENRLHGAEDADDVIGGSMVEDAIFGYGGDDRLQGTGVGDFLFGGAGDDTLEADAGNEAFGGVGDDSIVVFSDAGAVGMGGAGADTLQGARGDDHLDGGGGGDSLRGGAGDDTLLGDGGRDTLIGGDGADRMTGGQDGDFYYVDHAGDRALEVKGWSGMDTVVATVDYRARGSHIETIELAGGATFAKGNALDQTLIGTDGRNVLDGGGGANVLRGEGGNDLYTIRGGRDRVVEGADEGLDTARAFVSHRLADNVERLALLDGAGVPADLKGIGNALGNLIRGNAGDNVLAGREGRDVLRGMEGADTFLFDRSPHRDNLDIVADFDAAQGDVIALSVSALPGSGLAAGALAADALHVGPQATDAAHRFVYDPSNGRLYYDADGAGGAGQTIVAILGTRPEDLSHQQIELW